MQLLSTLVSSVALRRTKGMVRDQVREAAVEARNGRGMHPCSSCLGEREAAVAVDRCRGREGTEGSGHAPGLLLRPLHEVSALVSSVALRRTNGMDRVEDCSHPTLWIYKVSLKVLVLERAFGLHTSLREDSPV